MSQINHTNCEAFFLDFYDGNLDDSQIAELQTFLAEHPHWKSVFEEYAQTSAPVLFPGDQVNVHFSKSLKRNDQDDDLIAMMEGLLTKQDEIALQEKLNADSNLVQHYQVLQKTKLQPDTTVVFAEKKRLLKQAPVISLWRKYASAAAMIAATGISIWVFDLSTHDAVVEQPDEPQINFTQETNTSSSNPASETKEDHPHEKVTPETNEIISPSVGQIAASSPETTKDVAQQRQVEPTLVQQQQPPKEETPHRQSQHLELATLPTSNVQLPIFIDDAALRGSFKNPGQPIYPDAATEPSSPEPKSLFGTLVSVVGEQVVDRVKNISEEQLLIEQNVDPEEEIYTSTFKLGALEIYRSRTKK